MSANGELFIGNLTEEAKTLKVKVLLGNFTFHHFTEEELKLFITNNEQKTLIHRVDKEVEFSNLEAAYEFVKAEAYKYDSWIIPSEYKGEIVYEAKTS